MIPTDDEPFRFHGDRARSESSEGDLEGDGHREVNTGRPEIEGIGGEIEITSVLDGSTRPTTRGGPPGGGTRWCG